VAGGGCCGNIQDSLSRRTPSLKVQQGARHYSTAAEREGRKIIKKAQVAKLAIPSPPPVPSTQYPSLLRQDGTSNYQWREMLIHKATGQRLRQQIWH
jgi:hypothetical protein